uniref:Large ribosomal subunit protein uL1 n=1 Tax=Lepeophtheirus salmonis TaxID=72036 RepID=D3PIA5_LEPSM|nr:60S ribosomal protein L10a-3 [Lepeophtheirus salmonis]
MSKLDQKYLRECIHKIVTEKKPRKFAESIELQVGLKDYDVTKDKRFQGSVKLHHIIKDYRVCIIGDAVHVEEAGKLGFDFIDADGLKKFNKNKKQLKKWAKQFKYLLASESLIKQIPKLVGPVFSKIGKFPIVLTHKESMADKASEVRSTVEFQLKKALCLGTAIANEKLSEDQIRQNILLSVNYLVSLLKKNWNNVRTVHIKSTMGEVQRIYG